MVGGTNIPGWSSALHPYIYGSKYIDGASLLGEPRSKWVRVSMPSEP